MDDVEDLYPLTGTQAGMLYHAISQPDAGVYVVQVSCDLDGVSDPARLREAWQAVLARHPALRSAFVWEGLEAPLQAVRRTVTLPWTEDDWRHLDAKGQEARFRALQDAERGRGFTLARAPLMRVHAIQTGSSRLRMLWTAHHLVVDGWSSVLVLDELRSHLASGGDALAPDPPPFRRFVDWQANQAAGPGAQFWTRLLGEHAGGGLLAGDAGPGWASERRERRSRTVTAEDLTRLLAFCRDRRVTLATLVQAGWALVLSAQSGAADVMWGTVVSGRSPDLDGVERIVGPLLSTVPVPVHVDPDQLAEPWLVRLQERLLDVSAHASPGLAGVLDLLPADAPRPDLQTVVVYESAPPPGTAPVEGPRIRSTRYRDDSAFPLALLVLPGDPLTLTIVHDPGRFEGAYVDALLEQVADAVLSLATRPHDRLGDLLGASEAELTRIASLTAPEDPQPLPDPAAWDVVARFQRLAVEAPDALAVCSDDMAWSYRELDLRSTRVSARLRAAGAVGEGMVAVLASRSPHLLAGILGVLKSGCAYLPLDPSWPEARLRDMMNDAAVRCVLVGPMAETHPLVTAERPTLFLREGVEEPVALEDTLLPTPDPAAPAYRIYTSGSTGRPRGVQVSRANLAYSTWARGPAYQEVPERFLLVSPVSFDSAVVGLFWPLTTGGTLVLPATGTERDPGALARVVALHRITHLLCLPVVYGWLLDADADGAGTTLRTVIVAGEACPPSLVRTHLERVPQVRLFNEYGPSEATVWATLHRCDDPSGPRVPIGRPITGTEVRVVRSDGARAPVGAPGELEIRGPGVTEGYADDPAGTATRFLDLGGDRKAYRTGDLGRLRPDGTLEFLGRVDRQVKIRGHRIELAEVEAALATHPGVRECAALGDEDGARLRAFVVTENGTRPAEDTTLRRYLGERLPGAMVPDVFHLVEALPRGATGKVDTDALRAVARSATVSPAASAASTEDPLEAGLLALWREVLSNPVVGVDDGFFASGGHSLLAVRLLGRIREAVQVQLPMADLFAHPSPRTLAAHLRARAAGGDRGPERETFEF